MDPTHMKDCEEELSDTFAIKNKEINNETSTYKTIFEKK